MIVIDNHPPPRTVASTQSEMTEIIFPNDTNTMENLLGGRLMHFIDLTGALAAYRHTRTKVITAAMDHIDRTSVVATVLWAAMQKLDHGMTMNKVTSLIDRMLLDGCAFCGMTYEDFSIEVRVKLYTQLMVISGFFTKETAQTMLEESAKN